MHHKIVCLGFLILLVCNVKIFSQDVSLEPQSYIGAGQLTLLPINTGYGFTNTKGELIWVVEENSEGYLKIKNNDDYICQFAGPFLKQKNLVKSPWQWLPGSNPIMQGQIDGNILKLTINAEPYEFHYEIKAFEKNIKIRLTGSPDESQPYLAGFTFGASAPGTSEVIRIPFMEHMPIARVCDTYCSTWIDYNHSNGHSVRNCETKHSPAGAEGMPCSMIITYNPGDKGAPIKPLGETLWITASPDIEDHFPVPTNQPAPFRDRLIDKYIVLLSANIGQSGNQTWNHFKRFFDKMDRFGVDDLAAYYFGGWSYSCALNKGEPKHYPKCADGGTEKEWQAMLSSAHDRDYLLGFYTLYCCQADKIDGIPNPAFDISRSVVNANGEPNCNEGRDGKSCFISPIYAKDIAVKEHLLMKEDYNISLAFHDVSSAWLPRENYFDGISDSPRTHTMSEAIQAYREMHRAIREVVNGPVLGEGGSGNWWQPFDSFWGGDIESVERTFPTGTANKELNKGELAQRVPDYEQIIVNKFAAHHGLGFPSRFFKSPLDYPILIKRMQKYRAVCITFGHTAFMTTNGDVRNEYLTDAERIKDYYHISASLQPEYMGQKIEKIEYFIDGQWLSLSKALRKDSFDTFHPTIHFLYDSGLEIYVNFSSEPFDVSLGRYSVTLDEDGWIAFYPKTGLVNFSAIYNGYRIDYAYAPDWYEMIDGRGNKTTINEKNSRYLTIWNQKKEIKLIGDAQGKITIEDYVSGIK